MATFWTGAAYTADYGNLNGLRIQPGYGVLNRAIDRAMLAQLDDSEVPASIAEDDALMHCGYLECHHDAARHAFDTPW